MAQETLTLKKKGKTKKEDFRFTPVNLGGPALSGIVDEPPKKKIRRAKPDAAKTKTGVRIDYPQNGESLQPHHYAVRIGMSGGEGVEISIDGGEWQACRQTQGYFWHDWQGIAKGSHKLVARVKLRDGKFKKSKVVHCKVSRYSPS